MYEVIVGNIGLVYQGSNPCEAGKIFKEYKEQSRSGYGRASGESVTMFKHGEPIREYIGTLENQE
jgi:hypothetical protein